MASLYTCQDFQTQTVPNVTCLHPIDDVGTNGNCGPWGLVDKNLPTAQASASNISTSKWIATLELRNCKRGCQVFLQVSLFNHLAKTFIVEGGISFHE